MSRIWYGSLNNRLEEGRQFCDEIKVGTGVTEYSWSDREAYEVIEVKDQKHITIRKLDHKMIGEPMTNQWELTSNPNNYSIELVKRGDSWYKTKTATIDDLNSDSCERRLWVCMNFDCDKIREKGKQTKYDKINISIGVAQYYYDYEF